MEPGIGQGIQEKLQGILSKINKEQLRNRVTGWQKKLVATASSKFSFDSPSPASTEVTGLNPEDRGLIGDDGQSEEGKEENGQILEEAEVSDELTDSKRPGERPGTFREEIMEEEVPAEAKLSTPVEEPPRNKSPVQQWVDSLIDDHVRRDEEMPPIAEADQNDAEVESFTLGAEAPGVVCPRPYPFVQVTAHCGGSDAGSHCSSMESLLEARKPDPEEMLLELGFGGCEEPDIISRIPDRFLRPSSMKGVVIDDFIKHQQMMVHQFQSGFSGYRGLTGPSHAVPSGIVGKIMDRLLEAEVGRQNQEAYNRAQQQALLMNGAVQHCQASQTQGGYSPKLARLAHNLMVKMKGTKKEMSVLSPENRNWYENQGDRSPDPAGRRIIIGPQSYTFAKDGDLVADPNSTVVGEVEQTIEEPELKRWPHPKERKTKIGNGTILSIGTPEKFSRPSTADSKCSQVLFEVEEEEETPSSSKDEENCDISISLSLQTESVLTDTLPSSENWPSSMSVFGEEQILSYGLDTPLSAKDVRRGSLPEGVRPSIEKRRASLLESRKLHEERRRSLDVDQCSSCGSRKSSLNDLNEPAVKRSKSPVPGLEDSGNLDGDKMDEQSLFEDKRVPRITFDLSDEDENAMPHCDRDLADDGRDGIAEKRQSLSESEMNEWMSSNYVAPSPVCPSPRSNITAAPVVETLSLMEEMNLQSSLEQTLPEAGDSVHRVDTRGTDVSYSSLVQRRRSSDASCSRSHSEDKLSIAGSSGPSTPSSHSFDQEDAEVEYKNLILLLTQLQDAVTPSEEQFLSLNSKGRRHLQVAVIEEALRTYQKRLKELDLRGHLRDLLTGQLHRVTDLLDSTTSPSVLTIMKQMTTLLRHQEALRQELDLHEGDITKQSKKNS